MESDLMRRLQKAASSLGARLFRQNVGMAWAGRSPERITTIRRVLCHPGDVVLRNARPFRAGIAGMSDLGGWVPVKVTADMVGKTVAIYTQVEVKENARPTKEQNAWIEAVKKAGGRAGIAHNETELTHILGIAERD